MAKIKILFEEFSARVDKAYNGRLSVVESTYTGTRNKVTAYCNVHKIYFEVKEARNLTRHYAECPECLKEINDANNKKQFKKWEDALKCFIESYGNKFSYDESSYCGLKHKMKVHCNDCGEDFEITPIHHLKYNNGGCPNCHKHKVRKCSKCGKEFEVDRHYADSTEFICKECRNEIKREKELENECSLNSSENKKVRRKYNSQEERHQHKLERRKKRLENKLFVCPCCGQKHRYKEKCQTSELCRRHPNRLWYKNLIPFGFDYSKLGTLEYVDEYYKALEIIKTEYYINKLSPRQIYEKYNCSEYFKFDTSIRNILKSEHLEVRTRSEAFYNAIETGTYKIERGSIQYKTEYHMSWENKTFLLRSSYEIDFANILDENHISYEVEFFRIRYFDSQECCERVAIPDFYLPETNTIVEIKSTWTLDPINMLDRVKAYKENGYDFKLILEHKEVDIYSLINEPRIRRGNSKNFSLKTKKVGIKRKWRWMNDGRKNYQVLESQIEEYKSRGLVFGCLMNVRNKSNQDNLIVESLTQQSNPSDTSSNQLF